MKPTDYLMLEKIFQAQCFPPSRSQQPQVEISTVDMKYASAHACTRPLSTPTAYESLVASSWKESAEQLKAETNIVEGPPPHYSPGKDSGETASWDTATGIAG